MIGIINYGMGNLASVQNALDYLNIKSVIIDQPDKLKHTDKLLLPGVGAFGMAMTNLNNTGFSTVIKELVLVKKKPILGVCLGMQLLLEGSTEHGEHKGLGIIKGKVISFSERIKGFPIPHMGWNDAEYMDDVTLFKNIGCPSSYYFVHSYYCELSDTKQVGSITSYGVNFHSSINAENIFGCQFHPEKSQKNGLAIYKNFNSV